MGWVIPRKVRYPPELFIVATHIPSLPADKSEDVVYLTRPDFGPFGCWLRSLSALRRDGVKLWVDSDERTRIVEVDAGSRVSLDRSIQLSILSTRTLRVRVHNETGAVLTNYPVRATLQVAIPASRVPPVLDPYALDLIDIVEVAERVTVKAKKEERVGPVLTVAPGEMAVLLEVACERSTTPGDPLITGVRDEEELDPIDCFAMPDLELPERCWIPATSSLEVKLSSTAGVTDYRVRWRYAHAKLPPEVEEAWKALIKEWRIPVGR